MDTEIQKEMRENEPKHTVYIEKPALSGKTSNGTSVPILSDGRQSLMSRWSLWFPLTATLRLS